MSNLPPAYRTGWDRATYLLAEYKVLVSLLALGVVAMIAITRPSLPTPPAWVFSLLWAWLLLGPPCYYVGRRIAKWLRTRNWETVFHTNGAEDDREKWKVPPSTWEEKEVEGDSPNLVNDKSAYEVRRFEWYEDTERLVVEGTWLGEAKDSNLVTDKSHMRAIHDFLLDSYNELLQLRATWSDQSIEMQGQIINEGAEARERGLLVDGNSAKEIWEKHVEEPTVEHDVPKLEDAIAEGRTDEPTEPAPETNGAGPEP